MPPNDGRTVRELAYQMREVTIDNGTREGDVFFVSDDTILGNEFEIVATHPVEMDIDGRKESSSFVMVTFRGVVNNDGRLSSFTVMMPPVMARSLSGALKKKFLDIPLEYR